MSNTIIFSDSTLDKDQAWIDQQGIEIIKLTYIINDQEYIDEIDKDKIDAFYNMLKQGNTAKTSAISTNTFIEKFTPFLKDGKDIVYTGLASALSSTYANACIAKQTLAEQFTDRKIIIIDSLATTTPLAYVVAKGVQARTNGGTTEEIAACIEEYTTKFCGYFTVDDLQYLKRGGRLNSAAAAIGSLLNIKPMLKLTPTGNLDVVAKIKGRKKVYKFFLDAIKEQSLDPVNNTIFIIQADCIDDANLLAKMIRDEFGTKNIEINNLGTVIGSHTGPGTLAVGFEVAKRI